jgi:hypothetical protein
MIGCSEDMGHYHQDMHGESYSMPTFKCSKCGGETCIDCSFKGCCDYCIPDVDTSKLPEVVERTGPPPGSWADVARMMAQGDDSGFDWDAWKDQMKEQDF